jgi:hypothetical protein
LDLFKFGENLWKEYIFDYDSFQAFKNPLIWKKSLQKLLGKIASRMMLMNLTPSELSQLLIVGK